MDLGTAFLNTFVVVTVGVILTYVTNDRFKALRHEMDGLHTNIAMFRAEVKADIARLEDRLDTGLTAVHSEIVQVALAVGARGKTAQG